MKLLLISALALSSCGSKREPVESHTKVVNGIDITGDEHPAVVRIVMSYPNGYMGSCTGTFISHNILITASHCIDGASSVKTGKVKSVKILKNKLYKDNQRDWMYHDTALVKFPDNTSKHTMNVATKPIADKDVVTLVGFGLNDYVYVNGRGEESNYSRSGVKRKATNLYLKNSDLADGAVSFMGRGKNSNGFRGDGNYGSLGQGDSGGPLIVAGKGIVGIASAQGLRGSASNFENESFYAYTVSNHSKRFFEAASKIGMWPTGVQVPQAPEEQPKPDTQPQPQPQPQPESKSFAAEVIADSDGVYTFTYKGIPKGAVTIGFSLDGSSYIIDSEEVKGRKEFESESGWGLSGYKKITFIVKDANGKIISTLTKNIAK